MEKRSQPSWCPPIQCSDVVLPKLLLYNSLTSKKEYFVPLDGVSIKWYTCGPTVYDVSHMGHARTYVAFDVNRRILMDYFGFKVKYVVNITDVDDKIIKRARQKHLMEGYMRRNPDLASVITDICEAVKRLKVKSQEDPDPDKRNFLTTEANRLVTLLSKPTEKGVDPIKYLVENSRDAIADVLDDAEGAFVTDNAIFERLSSHFENEYHSDMKALNVLPPDVLIRVTGYIQPIIKYVQKIIDNGFAYVATSGSVYFDTNKFANHPKHFYAKLVPTAFGDTQQLATGEGELSISGEKKSTNDFALWKASKPGEPAWSSPWGTGRPGWHIECSAMASGVLGDRLDIHAGGVDLKFPHHDNELAQSEAYTNHSQWVNYFLHSGHLTISGCKMSKSLKNFITIRDALSANTPRQIRLIFLLHSWRDTLDYSPDTLSEAINYEKQLIDFLYNCSSLQYLAISEVPSATLSAQNAGEQEILPHLLKAQHDVYNAFCDSFDTRAALDVIKELITMTDVKIFGQLNTEQSFSIFADRAFKVARFILEVFRILGVADVTSVSQGSPVPEGCAIAGGVHKDILSKLNCPGIDNNVFYGGSWLSLDALTEAKLISALTGTVKASVNLVNVLLSEDKSLHSTACDYVKELVDKFGINLFDAPIDSSEYLHGIIRTHTGSDYTAIVKQKFALELHVWPVVIKCLHQLVSLRQAVRRLLITNKNLDKSQKHRLFTACDEYRDKYLPAAGVRLTDRVTTTDILNGRPDTPNLGLVDPCPIVPRCTEKLQSSVTQQSNPHSNGKVDEVEPISPTEMFRQQLDKYSRFDSQGIPTHDNLGNELSKSALKKVHKQYNLQAKRHAAYLNKNQ